MAAIDNAVSWSEIKTFQRCPKQHEYKYDQRLVPVKKARPLFLGSWFHAALESHYKGGDWRIGHQMFLDEYNKLFEEEREELDKRGKLPDIVSRGIKSYLWYYKDDGWKVREIEREFEVDTPLVLGGVRQRLKGIIDLVVEDEEGLLWIVDHKTASTIPEPTAFHAMDPQLMLYPWAAKIAFGWDIAGIYYNYVRSRAPTVPKLNKDGSVSRRKVVTDYPTLMRFIRDNGLDPDNFVEQRKILRRKSPFLRRYKYPREKYVTKEILLDALSVTKHIREDKRRSRTITRDCARMCPFHDICRAELNGMDTTMMRQQNFTLKEVKLVGDRPISDFDFEAEGE